uniref:Uncharacterized protein n=1 Tax=Rhizophora mucronata TaxID=61149 RepID=A0A2P2NE56_RHIMU
MLHSTNNRFSKSLRENEAKNHCVTEPY